AYQAIAIEDDYVAAGAPLYYFPLYTSLKGLGAGGSRDPTGLYEPLTQSADPYPYVRLKLPEAGAAAETLLLGGRPVLQTEDGVLTVRPLPNAMSGNPERLVLRFGGSAGSVRYRVRIYRDDACAPPV